MEEGSYILVMSSGNYMELNLKVDKTMIENHITYETLSHVSTYDIDISEIPYVEGMLIDFYHQPRHRFTIDVPQTIVVGIGKFGHRLYDVEGNLLTFNHVNYGFARTLYFLEAGTYDLTAFTWNPYDTFVDYELQVAIVDTPVIQDNYYLTDPMLYENMESPMTFNIDHAYDYVVIKLTVDDATTYNISVSKGLYIYNEALTQINVLNGDTSKNITFEPGIYYLVSSPYGMGNLRIYISLND